MARVVFAWELGSGYGHLARLLPLALALALRARGHEPVFAVRDLMGAEALLTPHGIAALQAPAWLGTVSGLPPAMHYAEMLMRFGFLHPTALTGICRAWRHLLQLLQPALVVFDHAPTALLATRDLPLARLNMGNGFCIPPPGPGMPPFMALPAEQTARVQHAEQQVLATAQQVLQTFNAAPLVDLSDLGECDEQWLCTFAELDHYTVKRDATRYVGPLFAGNQGVAPDWPDGDGPRIFAYLRPDYAALEPVLAALHGSAARVLVHVPGVARRTVQQWSSARMAFSAAPLSMATMSAQCEGCVAHGGAGTTAAMLLAGKPVLLPPMHMEQVMAARRVVALGAGLALALDDAGHLPQPLGQLLADPALAQGARAFAARHAGYDERATVAFIADRCAALLQARAAA
jgi:UDP:flavonoid glycosyltransferase YjiC (YdhE family)